jgi:DNA-binding transcriptional LysR family regulator
MGPCFEGGRVHLDLDGVESFLVVAEEVHFGNAAARLHISPSALTKRVQRLERDLKVRLLERNRAGVVALTPAGVRLVAHGRGLLEHERATREAAQGHATVTLGVPDDGGTQSVTAQEILDVRRTLRLDHPEVTLLCRRTPLPCTTTWLVEGQVDVQLTSAVVEDGRIHSTPVGIVERMAAVPTGSDVDDAHPLPLADLLALPMLHDPGLPQAFMRPFWFGDLRSDREARLVPIAARDGGSVLDQVARSVGVTVQLRPQARRVRSGVRFVPIAGAPPLVLHAARRGRDRRPVVLSLVQTLMSVPVARG